MLDVHFGGVQSGDIRLFGSSRDFSGAVQIYSSYGWQAICPDSSWTNRDADTICQDLGYAGGVVISPISTSRGPGGEPVSRRLYNAACPGELGRRNRFGVCSFSVGTTNTSNCAQPQGQYASLNCSKCQFLQNFQIEWQLNGQRSKVFSVLCCPLTTSIENKVVY